MSPGAIVAAGSPRSAGSSSRRASSAGSSPLALEMSLDWSGTTDGGGASPACGVPQSYEASATRCQASRYVYGSTTPS
jgi:hypothetical protein